MLLSAVALKVYAGFLGLPVAVMAIDVFFVSLEVVREPPQLVTPCILSARNKSMYSGIMIQMQPEYTINAGRRSKVRGGT